MAHSGSPPPWQNIAGFTACVVAGLLVLWLVARQPAPAPAGSAAGPEARFIDITAAAGIDFIHRNGATPEKLLPETMGGGVAWFDYDNDGAPDLLLVNGTDWPGNTGSTATTSRASVTTRLYHNDGSGRFTDATSGSGLDLRFYGMGAACGDFDNDGWVDVFLTGVGEQHLMKNLGGGRFADVTDLSGVRGSRADWSTSAAWLDYDNDGRLDLFVCRYVAWTAERDRAAAFSYDGRTRAYGPPRNFAGTFPQLFHNDGGGRFTDRAAPAGLQVTNAAGQPLAKALGVAPVDLDADGWIDLIVANDTVQNLVFRNEHNGAFREIGARSGVAFDAFGAARGAMGIDTARFRDGDQALGIAIGNFANEMNSLYVAQNDPLHFADEAAGAGLGPASQTLLKFGLFFFDYDLDGRPDVLTANGHLDPDISRFQSGQTYRQPAQLFWNRGEGRHARFVPVSPERAGPDLFQPIAGRGSACADIDGDGDLDAVLCQVGGPPLLLRNEQKLGHHWVRLKLEGTQSNRDAIGAWAKVRVGGRLLAQQVMPTKGYLSQSELPLTFGLGTATQVDETEVIWPGGKRQRITGLRIDAVTRVRETR